MFRSSGGSAEVVEIEQGGHSCNHDDSIPLSHLQLDMEAAPASGWTAWLAERGISIVFDDLGRRCIARSDAKQLLDAQRQNEIRKQDHAVRLEAEAIEADRAWRATLPRGVHWTEIPAGVLPAQAMNQAGLDERPRRTPSHGEWMFSDPDEVTGGTFNGESGDDW
jgi:hypothetical protein